MHWKRLRDSLKFAWGSWSCQEKALVAGLMSVLIGMGCVLSFLMGGSPQKQSAHSPAESKQDVKTTVPSTGDQKTLVMHESPEPTRQFIELPDGTRIIVEKGLNPAKDSIANAEKNNVPSRPQGTPLLTPPQSPVGADGKIQVVWNPLPGFKCKTTYSSFLKLPINTRLKLYNQPESTIPQTHEVYWKRRYIDHFILAGKDKARQVVRSVEEDSITTQNPQTNKMEAQDGPLKGTNTRFFINGDGRVEVTSDDADAHAIDAYKAVRLGTLLPGRPMSNGEEWILTSAQIQSAFSFVTRGEGKLRLIKTEWDSDLGQHVSLLSGIVKIDYNIPFGGDAILPLFFEGQITVKYSGAYGIELIRKLEGQVSINHPFTSGAISGRLVGTGEYREVTSSEALKS